LHLYADTRHISPTQPPPDDSSRRTTDDDTTEQPDVILRLLFIHSIL